VPAVARVPRNSSLCWCHTGDGAKHARSEIGVTVLPGGAAVELEIVVAGAAG